MRAKGGRAFPAKRIAVMVAIAGVLLNFDAAFACTTKAKAYVSAMKSDLRNLVSTQEAFFADSQRYTNDLELLGFRKSTGVAITFGEIGRTSWTATATHTQSPVVCHIFVGARPVAAPQAGEGEPWCVGNPTPTVTVNESLAYALWVLVLVLALTTAIFLRVVGKRNWPAWGIVALGVVYPTAMFPFCGPPSTKYAALFVVPALLLFTFALRRRVVTPG